MSSVRTYRHQVTGLVGQFPENVANVDVNLVEVADDAKPLAYTPITQEEIDAVRAETPTDEKVTES